jgi:alkanesulfonate monooxygenase SsuD/methylene tetrahydromethanopterin reductase-like flavin-dependent oxidoreductase (luciferase family)
MQLGYFAMPAHPPERDLKQAFDWNVEVIRWLDEFGFAEAWIGEHHAVPWEPIPAPDLIIAQAFRETKNIRLGPGGFILPFHHPIQIADRLALLDQISGGRVNFGVATGSIPIDWTSFNFDPAELHDMARESLEIIVRWWTEPAPWTHKGKFWTVTKPEKMYDLFWHHLTPVQKPHPPIGMAGISPGSSTLKACGARGFLPMSLAFNNSYLASHWQAVEEGAATTGRTADRNDWRIARQILVADTDAEATKLAVEGGMGYFEVNYDLKLLKALGVIDLIKSDKDMPDSDLTAEHMARHNWIVGSPSTVAEKIEEMNAATGGFGTLMVLGYDYIDQPDAWRHSLELLAKEVMPRIAKL